MVKGRDLPTELEGGEGGDNLVIKVTGSVQARTGRKREDKKLDSKADSNQEK